MEIESDQLLDVEWVENFLKALVGITPLLLYVVNDMGYVLAWAGPVDVPDELIEGLFFTPEKIGATPDVIEQARAPIEAYGKTLGYVICMPVEPYRVTPQAAAYVTRLAGQALSSFYYREYELNNMAMELLNKYEEITLLYELSNSLGSVFDVPTICEIALEKALQAVSAKCAVVLLKNEDGRGEETGGLTITAQMGVQYCMLREGLVWEPEIGEGISGGVVESGRQFLLDNGETPPAGAEEEHVLLGGGAVLSVPLVFSATEGDNEIIGVLTVGGMPPGGMFTAGDAKMLTTIANQAASAIHKSRMVDTLREAERVRHEMAIAQDIQQSLLPERPPEVRGIELVGQCVPATRIGGDYYDFLVDEKGRLTFLIADVSGHSVGPALIMTIARSIIRHEVLAGKSPAGLLFEANNTMMEDLTNSELFITMFCARYDPASRRLTFANGGHNNPLLRRASDGQIVKLEADGLIIGMVEDVVFEEPVMALQPGDLLLLYTDGIVEAENEAGEQFGDGRLEKLFAENGSMPPSLLADHIYKSVRRHAGEVDQQDDITLVILKVLEE